MLSVVSLRIVIQLLLLQLLGYSEFYYAENRNAVCRQIEHCYAYCHCAECNYFDCCFADNILSIVMLSVVFLKI